VVEAEAAALEDTEQLLVVAAEVVDLIQSLLDLLFQVGMFLLLLSEPAVPEVQAEHLAALLVHQEVLAVRLLLLEVAVLFYK
jgi:hypothetical protein